MYRGTYSGKWYDRNIAGPQYDPNYLLQGGGPPKKS